MFTTPDGTSLPYAPSQLRDMAYIFTTGNLKKYLNGFLGLSAPIGINVPLLYNQDK